MRAAPLADHPPASQQSSPVDDAQLAHIRKVVKLLSLSDEQIAAMEPSERQTVTSIRESAVSAVADGERVRESAHGSPSAGGVPRMQTDPEATASARRCSAASSAGSLAATRRSTPPRRSR